MSDVDQTIERLGRALEQLESGMDAIECHGILTGLLCAQGKMEERKWLAIVAPDAAPGNVLAREAETVMEFVMTETFRQLNEPELGFQPLLPTDEEPLRERVEGLGHWCQGFLLGMSEGGIRDMDALPEDTRELTRDFVEIARAESYSVDEDEGEEDEAAYSDLVEYVRTGVLLINEELNPSKAPPRDEDGITYH